MLHRSVLLAICMLALVCVVLSQSGTIPFTYQDRLIYLPVSVNGEDSLLFLLDTGANVSAIDQGTADELSLPELRVDTVEGTAGKIVVPNVQARSVSVGGIEVRDIHFTKYDMTGMLAPPGHRLQGILGMDVMQDMVVSIVFKDSSITFSSSMIDTLANALEIEMDNGIPRTTITIGGVEMLMRFDTGSSIFESEDVYLNVTERFMQQVLEKHQHLKPVTHFSATGIGGAIEMPVYLVDDVRFGEIELQKTYLIVQPATGYFAKADAVGFCGNNLLEKFGRVVFDVPGRKVCVGRVKW